MGSRYLTRAEPNGFTVEDAIALISVPDRVLHMRNCNKLDFPEVSWTDDLEKSPGPEVFSHQRSGSGTNLVPVLQLRRSRDSGKMP